MRVGHCIGLATDDAKQATENLPMALTGDRDPHARNVQPFLDLKPGFGDRLWLSEQPGARHQSYKREQARPRQSDSWSLVEHAFQPLPRCLMLGKSGDACIN